MTVAFLPLLWTFHHLVKSAFSTFGGALSDRAGRRRTIVLGWAVLRAGLSRVRARLGGPRGRAVFAVYGLYHALTEGPEKAFVADLADRHARGKAFGLYHAVTGALVLPGNLLTGLALGPLLRGRRPRRGSRPGRGRGREPSDLRPRAAAPFALAPHLTRVPRPSSLRAWLPPCRHPPRPRRGLDFGRCFSFVTEDPDWVKKVLIGGAFTLASIFLVGAFFVAGYFARLVKRVAASRAAAAARVGRPRRASSMTDCGWSASTSSTSSASCSLIALVGLPHRPGRGRALRPGQRLGRGRAGRGRPGRHRHPLLLRGDLRHQPRPQPRASRRGRPGRSSRTASARASSSGGSSPSSARTWATTSSPWSSSCSPTSWPSSASSSAASGSSPLMFWAYLTLGHALGQTVRANPASLG